MGGLGIIIAITICIWLKRLQGGSWRMISHADLGILRISSHIMYFCHLLHISYAGLIVYAILDMLSRLVPIVTWHYGPHFMNKGTGAESSELCSYIII